MTTFRCAGLFTEATNIPSNENSGGGIPDPVLSTISIRTNNQKIELFLKYCTFTERSSLSMIFPNGAGKTTASYTVLPEIWYCKEFVNADNIAAGIFPFNAESVALEAGRIMLKRIRELMEEKADFAFETTLATRSYVSLIKEARERG